MQDSRPDQAVDLAPRDRSPLATTFRRDEVEMACAIFRKMSVGEDIRILARSPACQSLYTKFAKLREKARDE
jgi:hypothetical protein